jgi:hypothetical protein
VENLEIKNRLPQPALSQADLDQLAGTGQNNSGLVLEQMLRGTFALPDNNQEEFFG